MERLGLGYDDLRRIRPGHHPVVGFGAGPSGAGAGLGGVRQPAQRLLGFAALNDPWSAEPRTGLGQRTCLVAYSWRSRWWRRSPSATAAAAGYIDFSMLEGLLWTMPAALVVRQQTGAEPTPTGNADTRHDRTASTAAPRGSLAGHRRDGGQEWRALCDAVPALRDLAGLTTAERRAAQTTIDARIAAWARDQDDIEAAAALQAGGAPAAASATANDLADAHLGALPSVGPRGRRRRAVSARSALAVGRRSTRRAAGGAGAGPGHGACAALVRRPQRRRTSGAPEAGAFHAVDTLPAPPPG
ncbi:MAG: CoA transferase [Dehalococcoidia bacterium]